MQARWRSQIPHPASKKVSWSPDEEALEWFASLVLPEQAAERYVLALALTRKRLLRLVRTETDAAGAETMFFISAVDDSEHAVTVVEPSAEEIDAIARISPRSGAWIVSDEIYRGAELEGDGP